MYIEKVSCALCVCVILGGGRGNLEDLEDERFEVVNLMGRVYQLLISEWM